MEVTVKIASGICGMNSKIELKGSMEDYRILLSSDCQLVQSLKPYLGRG